MKNDNERIVIRQSDGREDLMLRCDNCGRKLMPRRGSCSLICYWCQVPKEDDNTPML